MSNSGTCYEPGEYCRTSDHGMSGLAPRWSLAIGLGTAFPYLNHLGAGSPIDQLNETFGGGTHGLGNGTNSGPGNSGNAGGGSGNAKGKGRKTL